MKLTLPRILIGFEFYGAGNIGDDLMLKGFIDTFTHHVRAELNCFLPGMRIQSQQKRFKQIKWLSLEGHNKEDIVLNYDCWVGVGGTPFQASSGRWLLKQIYQDFLWAKNVNKWMIGVGCEDEVLKEKKIALSITNDLQYIWTRDEKSRDLLINSLGVANKRVTTGGDLAHISLRNIFSSRESQIDKDKNVGIIFYAEKIDHRSLLNFKKITYKIMNDRNVTFLANDVRSEGKFEQDFYKKLFGGFKSIFRSKPGFFSPDYETSNVEGLVKHFLDYDIVMASRYHAILTAAWAGCRVVALDRSSKIRNLANELDIPLIKAPFTVDTLYEGYCNAKTVPRALLEEKALAAEKSVIELCRMIG